METPRRRSQQNDETNAQMDTKSPEKCVKAIRQLKQEVANAKKTLINGENCIVNRAFMQELLDDLENNLPEAVKSAAEIVSQQESMLQKINDECTQKKAEVEAQAQAMSDEATNRANAMMTQANQEANALMEKANQEANALMEKANQEANACVEAAKAEAARMVEDGEKKARQLVEEETIMRRARAESEELREQVQQETTQLRKNTLDFVDQQLMEADRSISEMLNSIRLERNEVRNRR